MLLCPSSTRAGSVCCTRGIHRAHRSKFYPCGFRDDLVRVARNRESGVRIEQIVKDFGVHLMMLQRWMCRVDIDEGARPGQACTEFVELREVRKRFRLLEQGNEVFRWAAGYLSQADLPGKAVPARDGARRCGVLCDGEVSGAHALLPALLPVVGGAHHQE